MDIVLEKFKRLPLATIFAARNYGMDNISVPESAHLGSKLCMAILRGDNMKMVEFLQRGADINHVDEPDGWTPLIYSIYYDNKYARDELLKQGADILKSDYSYRTPLMFAAIRGDSALIKKLIRLGANIREQDIMGKSALDFAREYHKYNCVDLLS